MASEAAFVVATRDWHPPDHGSFAAQGGPWPVHCVGGTPGRSFIRGSTRAGSTRSSTRAGLRTARGTRASRTPSSSGCCASAASTAVDVAGLALDYCVKATALDARRAGFDVTVHRGATRAVEVSPGDGERAVAELRAAGVEVVD